VSPVPEADGHNEPGLIRELVPRGRSNDRGCRYQLSRDAAFLLGLQKAGVRFVAADMPEATALHKPRNRRAICTSASEINLSKSEPCASFLQHLGLPPC
jgi:hypothetical protein